MKTPLGTKIGPNEICPESGVWKALATSATGTPFLKGDRMPPYGGFDVVWQLKHYSAADQK